MHFCSHAVLNEIRVKISDSEISEMLLSVQKYMTQNINFYPAKLDNTRKYDQCSQAKK